MDHINRIPRQTLATKTEILKTGSTFVHLTTDSQNQHPGIQVDITVDSACYTHQPRGTIEVRSTERSLRAELGCELNVARDQPRVTTGVASTSDTMTRPAQP